MYSCPPQNIVCPVHWLLRFVWSLTLPAFRCSNFSVLCKTPKWKHRTSSKVFNRNYRNYSSHRFLHHREGPLSIEHILCIHINRLIKGLGSWELTTDFNVGHYKFKSVKQIMMEHDLLKIFGNYWVRLSIFWRIMQIKVGLSLSNSEYKGMFGLADILQIEVVILWVVFLLFLLCF